MLQSSAESGARAGYDGCKRKEGSKVLMAVETLGHLLALYVTPANGQERAQVEELAKVVRAVTNQHVELAYVDQGYIGEEAQSAAVEQGIRLEVVKLPEAKRGFVLLPRGLGGRALVRLDEPLQVAGSRLRTPCYRPGRDALRAFAPPLLHRATPLLAGGL